MRAGTPPIGAAAIRRRRAGRVDRRRGSSAAVVGVLAAIVAVSVVTAGCGCDVDCGRTPAVEFVEGSVVDVDGARVVIEVGSDRMTIDVTGPTWALHEGERYRFPLFEPRRATGPPTARLPGRCACGDAIIGADGEPVPTGVWAWAEPRLVGLVVWSVAGGALVIASWRVARALGERRRWSGR